jgi:shikimate dehydrogenase
MPRDRERMAVGAQGQPADRGDAPRTYRPATRLGVLGWPVAHSRSPAMHTAALAAVGLQEWTYQRLPVPPELFAETTRALGAAGFVGANVTIPHKQAALALADSATAAARAIGAANTLSFAPDGTIAAENTDAPGLIAALGHTPPDGLGCSPRGLRALVLGAGGSARAVVWALREAGAREVSVWNRTAARAAELASALDVRAVPEPEPADILVNCTSVGLDVAPTSDAVQWPVAGESRAVQRPVAGEPGALDRPVAGGPGAVQRPAGGELGGPAANATDGQRVAQALNQLHLTLDLVGRYSYVIDLVYRADTTPLLLAARQTGVPTLDGLELLVAQGALSFELWTGRAAPLEVMRAAAREGDRGEGDREV